MPGFDGCDRLGPIPLIMNFLRLLKAIVVNALLAASCTLAGGAQLYERLTYEEPVPMRCGQSLAGKTWVTLSGCEAVLIGATVHQQGKRKTVRSLEVPIRPVGTDVESTLILETSDEALVSAAQRVVAMLEKDKPASGARPAATAEVEAKLAGLAEALAPVPVATFQGLVSDGGQRVERREPGAPSLTWAATLLGFGALWGLLFLRAVLSLVRPRPAEGEVMA